MRGPIEMRQLSAIANLEPVSRSFIRPRFHCPGVAVALPKRSAGRLVVEIYPVFIAISPASRDKSELVRPDDCYPAGTRLAAQRVRVVAVTRHSPFRLLFSEPARLYPNDIGVRARGVAVICAQPIKVGRIRA